MIRPPKQRPKSSSYLWVKYLGLITFWVMPYCFATKTLENKNVNCNDQKTRKFTTPRTCSPNDAEPIRQPQGSRGWNNSATSAVLGFCLEQVELEIKWVQVNMHNVVCKQSYTKIKTKVTKIHIYLNELYVHVVELHPQLHDACHSRP